MQHGEDDEEEDEMAIRSIGKADMHKIQCMPKRRNGLTLTKQTLAHPSRKGRRKSKLS